MAKIECQCCGETIDRDDPQHCHDVPAGVGGRPTCPEPGCGSEGKHCCDNGAKRCWAGHRWGRPGVPATGKLLRPNSPEWIAALAEQNPQQATLTRAMVSAAGREDACSICGDTPSSEYRRTDTDARIASIRLCDGCLRIQRSMGSVITPVN